MHESLMTTPKSTPQSPLLEPKLPLKFKWRQGSDMPFEMTSGPSAVLMKGDIYFGGGYASSDKDEQTVCVYSPSSDSWSQLTLYEYRYFSLTVINENQLVAIGGIAVSTRKKTNKLAVWDDKQRQWVFSLPVMKTACNSPAATTYNQWMLVAGGYGEQGRLSRVEVMNVSYEQWYRVASLPVAGSHMASTIIGNMWYISGGNTNDGASKSVMSVCVEHIILDAISQSGGANPSTLSRWNSLSDTPLITPTVLAFHGALLAVGCGGIFSLTSAIYLYQPSKSKWIKAGDMPTERDKPACTVLPNGHIMIAGGFGANNRVDIAQVM